MKTQQETIRECFRIHKICKLFFVSNSCYTVYKTHKLRTSELTNHSRDQYTKEVVVEG